MRIKLSLFFAAYVFSVIAGGSRPAIAAMSMVDLLKSDPSGDPDVKA